MMNALMTALLLALALPAFGAEYWPLDADRIYRYEDRAGRTLVVTYLDWGNGHIERECACTSAGVPVWWTWEGFEVRADGTIYLHSNSHYWQGAIDPDYMWTYDPGLKFLDAAPAVGGSWLTQATAFGYGSRPLIHFCTIDRAETVTVPHGTFETLVLVETDLLSSANHSGTYYLNREIGPVILPGGFELVAIEGSVAVESSTWGEVKALFR